MESNSKKEQLCLRLFYKNNILYALIEEDAIEKASKEEGVILAIHDIRQVVMPGRAAKIKVFEVKKRRPKQRCVIQIDHRGYT